MEFKHVLHAVKEAIAESVGIDAESIQPNSTLFDDLGVSSLDLISILYTVEMEFNIQLKVSDLINDSRDALNGKPFEIDNVITDEGLKVVKEKMSEIPAEKLVPGMTVYELINLITVVSLTKMVMIKIDEKKAEQKED